MNSMLKLQILRPSIHLIIAYMVFYLAMVTLLPWKLVVYWINETSGQAATRLISGFKSGGSSYAN